MNSSEIYEELQMTYYDLQKYLLQKYGPSEYDYFLTCECRSKNPNVTRSNEGLQCHHMDEDKGVNLSNPNNAFFQPFDWQRKERLVYCNLLEHLILHIKIAILRQKSVIDQPTGIARFFTTGGIYQVCSLINDLFMTNGSSVAWRKRCFEEIKDNYNDYIALINSIIAFIESHYSGEKKPALIRRGNILPFKNGNCEILKYSVLKDYLLIKLPSGKEQTIKAIEHPSILFHLTYADEIDTVARRMAFGFTDFHRSIFKDILSFSNKDTKDTVLNYSSALAIDFTGYGFVQYADIALSSDYGSKNADQYISKGLPMYCEKTISLKGKKPVFWKESFPKNIDDAFYIVRFRTAFEIKDGQTPFIRYREPDLYRRPYSPFYDEINNELNNGWAVLSTSDVFDKKTGEKLSAKEIHLGTPDVILTLGKDDFLLFQKRYNIRYMSILDGCYFIDE